MRKGITLLDGDFPEAGRLDIWTLEMGEGKENHILEVCIGTGGEKGALRTKLTRPQVQRLIGWLAEVL